MVLRATFRTDFYACFAHFFLWVTAVFCDIFNERQLRRNAVHYDSALMLRHVWWRPRHDSSYSTTHCQGPHTDYIARLYKALPIEDIYLHERIRSISYLLFNPRIRLIVAGCNVGDASPLFPGRAHGIPDIMPRDKMPQDKMPRT